MAMSLNEVGLIAAACMLIGGGLSFYLGRRKTRTPFLVGIIGTFLSLIPVLGLIYLAVLSVRPDVSSDKPAD
ncbi:hypothetical protein EB809_19350 [Marinobacter sp. R17]|uniref:hypothetical protein n=1 Tax=Marinobacter sp. R17 TaxID=2484250 RepID=UPI000F4CA0DF|nr:hypothetical protein [Marinobacter sp. R17]ROT94545.1 hypothetical protein EB809_19350 [Marinobacter sp. R17]